MADKSGSVLRSKTSIARNWLFDNSISPEACLCNLLINMLVLMRCRTTSGVQGLSLALPAMSVHIAPITEYGLV